MNRQLGYSVYLSLIRNGSVSLDDIGNGAPVFLSLHIEEEFDENYSSDILRLCSRLHDKGCRIIADISKKTLEMLGTDVDAIAEKLAGNTCGFRSTSCADQLAQAVLEAKAKENT